MRAWIAIVVLGCAQQRMGLAEDIVDAELDSAVIAEDTATIDTSTSSDAATIDSAMDTAIEDSGASDTSIEPIDSGVDTGVDTGTETDGVCEPIPCSKKKDCPSSCTHCAPTGRCAS